MTYPPQEDRGLLDMIPEEPSRRLAWAFFVISLVGFCCGWGGVLIVASLVLITEYT